MKTIQRILASLITLALAAPAFASEILPLSEVRKGMKGYGITVFEGSRAERFDVEIIGVLHKIGPNQDMILARVDSEPIRKSGVVAGMSGSPIYINDKVIGALAYAWPFAKEPIAGVTPIEEMLRIERTGGNAPKMAVPASTGRQLLTTLANRDYQKEFEKLTGALHMRAPLVSGTLPIATPVSFAGFAPETIARFSPTLAGAGFLPVPAGSSTGSVSRGDELQRTSFEPGDAIGAVLIEGDFSVAATGTVTHVDGNRIYAFGHPFLDMGEVEFPMARTEVVGVLPSMASSFKFVNTGPVIGALTQDRSAGIVGYVGKKAEMVPIELELRDGARTTKYQFRVVRQAQLFPFLIAMVADNVVAAAQRAQGERTLLLESSVEFEGFAPIHLREGWAGNQARQSIPAYLAIISNYLLSNEFQGASINRVKLTLRHEDSLKIASIVEASVETPADGEINPGDTVAVRALLKPFRGPAFAETFQLTIPDGLRPGNSYLFVGSGSAINQLDFILIPPDPRTLAQLIGVLSRLRPSTELTVGLYSPSEGAVAAGVYLPSLPPSIGAIVRADSSNSLQMPVKYHAPEHLVRPLDYIVDGGVKIDLEIRPRL